MLAIFAAALLGHQSEPPTLIGHVAVKVGGEVIVAGGHAGRDNNTSNWSFSPASGKWRIRTPWRAARGFPVAVEHGCKLFAFGGINDDGSHSNQIDAYDPTADKWSKVGTMPETMTRSAGVVWHGKLYLSGGYYGINDRQGAGNSARLWQYDFVKRVWKSLSPMSTPRHGNCLVIFKNRLWAIGGFGNEHPFGGKVESYDPARNEWRKEAALPFDRGFFGAAVVRGKLVAFGQLFKPAHPVEWTPNGWKDRPASDLPIRRFAYVQDGDSVLVFGGEENGVPIQRFKP
jgi:hypothetical protein